MPVETALFTSRDVRFNLAGVGWCPWAPTSMPFVRTPLPSMQYSSPRPRHSRISCGNFVVFYRRVRCLHAADISIVVKDPYPCQRRWRRQAKGREGRPLAASLLSTQGQLSAFQGPRFCVRVHVSACCDWAGSDQGAGPLQVPDYDQTRVFLVMSIVFSVHLSGENAVEAMASLLSVGASEKVGDTPHGCPEQIIEQGKALYLTETSCPSPFSFSTFRPYSTSTTLSFSPLPSRGFHRVLAS